MDQSNSYNLLCRKIDYDLSNFCFLDNFFIDKRRSLMVDAQKIINHIFEEKVSIEQLDHLKGLHAKLVQRARGGWFSTFCLRFFRKSNKLEDLKLQSQHSMIQVNKINKLIKANVGIEHLSTFLHDKDSANKLDKLVFEDHIYARMDYFGHVFTFNSEGQVTFKYSDRSSIDDEIPEDTIAEIEEPDEYWQDLYQEFAEKGLSLEIKGEFNEGCYKIIPVSNLSIQELKDLIVLEDGSFNKKIQVIYPSKELTLEELEGLGVLDKDEETNEYFIDSDYQYLENGFTRYADEEWQNLRPFAYNSQPPKEFTIDIVVHSKIGMPGVFGEQGHASVKMTTPSGEIYSVGLFPEDTERDPYNLSLQRGKLISPDPYLFMPTSSYEHHVMSYTLSDPKAFHKLIKWIEAVQGYHIDEKTGDVSTSNLFYLPSHHSCAAFASASRDYALELGAKSQKLAQRKISNWTKLGIRVKESLLNFMVTNFKKFQWSQGIEYAGFTNYNITHLNPKGIYLPVDLILDHQKT